MRDHGVLCTTIVRAIVRCVLLLSLFSLTLFIHFSFFCYSYFLFLLDHCGPSKIAICVYFCVCARRPMRAKCAAIDFTGGSREREREFIARSPHEHGHECQHHFVRTRQPVCVCMWLRVLFNSVLAALACEHCSRSISRLRCTDCSAFLPTSARRPFMSGLLFSLSCEPFAAMYIFSLSLFLFHSIFLPSHARNT